jgi:hypothetical protein
MRIIGVKTKPYDSTVVLTSMEDRVLTICFVTICFVVVSMAKGTGIGSVTTYKIH